MFDRDLTAYLGDGNSYSHAAAVRLAGGALKGYGTLQAVLAAVGTECGAAVLPVENNVEGAVNEVYDALFDSELYIDSQLVLPVQHSLIAADGVKIGDIRRVVSHPQAIAQCRRFLGELGVPVMSAASTSAALKTLYDRNVNMTRILSRPHRSGDGQYRFFVDFDFEGSGDELGAALSELKRCCTAFRFLGRYDCAHADDGNK